MHNAVVAQHDILNQKKKKKKKKRKEKEKELFSGRHYRRFRVWIHSPLLVHIFYLVLFDDVLDHTVLLCLMLLDKSTTAYE